MVASVGPVLEVVVDGGGPVGQPPIVLAYLPLDCAGQRREFCDDLGPRAGRLACCGLHM